MDLKFGHNIFFIFSICAIGFINCATVPGTEEKLHDRVLHGQKLSEKEHFEHDGDDVHDLVLISSTFYASLFLTKVLCAAFL